MKYTKSNSITVYRWDEIKVQTVKFNRKCGKKYTNMYMLVLGGNQGEKY